SDDIAVDLGQMNLFIVPVTYKLLSSPSRAMEVDIAFAKSENIPILPFMVEPNIERLYAKEENFGSRQYLNPDSGDLTEISYNDKLKKYLASVLVGDEVIQRVRKAFDAYMFLSYRKKDRKYANELMKMIHDIPQYRDIAIWYDEFLTPGENFEQNIKRALQDSKLFTLLVTPNLLEQGNFVMTQEYPTAKQLKVDILPAEMVETDKTKLARCYDGIPECVNPRDGEKFKTRLLNALDNIDKKESSNDEEHNYLIGLAYLEGIEVEVDRNRALELITASAQNGFVEAMQKLFEMYREGIGVARNFAQATYWCEKMVGKYIEIYGEEHDETLTAYGALAVSYRDMGQYQKALEIQKKVYLSRRKILGEEHHKTLSTLSAIAVSYNILGEYAKALEINEELYAIRYRKFGDGHPDTILSMGNLASSFYSVGKYNDALQIHEKVYSQRKEFLGDEHIDTLRTLSNIAICSSALGDNEKALNTSEKVYRIGCKILGEEHPETLTFLSNLATFYGNANQHQKALKLKEKLYDLRSKILGEEHPDTVTTLGKLAVSYYALGEYEKSLQLNERAYELTCKILGEDHPNAINGASNLAYSYRKLGKYQSALALNEKNYAVLCKKLGAEHPNSLYLLNNLATAYFDLKNYAKATELYQKAYEISRRVLGDDHPNTKLYKENYDYCISKLNN
ncbi:MAG: tetratricopeptide repeat protein, partial [Clostridia bacterium]|nr:tetratricopeptide repeat protein [Clostridia bacterium]